MVTVIYRKQIRTARNILIFNLALSDLLLGTPLSTINPNQNVEMKLFSSLDSAPDLFRCSDLHLALCIPTFMQVETKSSLKET